VRNYFDYEATKKSEIQIQNKIRIGQIIPLNTKGQVIINQRSIALETDHSKPSGHNTFHGKIVSLTRFPDQYECTIDIGLPIHVILNPESFDKINIKETLIVHIDPEKLDFIPNTKSGSF
jgi:hypothetical protein